jgi:hypothetical protein
MELDNSRETMVAGAGGNAQASGSSATDGGDTVWDTGAVVATTTATGGGGATGSAIGTTQSGMPEAPYYTQVLAESRPVLSGGFYGTQGTLTSGNTARGGGFGQLKQFTYEPTANVAYTIGAGGAEGQANTGDGNQGVIELYY